MNFLTIFVVILVAVAAVAVLGLVAVRARNPPKLKRNAAATLGFFHPFCDGGGGGERVLWTAINAIHQEHENVKSVIYVREGIEKVDDVLRKVKDQFNLSIQSKCVEFVPLSTWWMLEAKWYPHFTLLGQSFGSMLVAVESFMRRRTDVFLETTGHAFTFIPIKVLTLGSVPVVAYVHYPTISADMLQKVRNRQADYNNSSAVSRNPFLSSLKLSYYRIFAVLYGFAGSFADVVMVNSTWTLNHINEIWYGIAPKPATSNRRSKADLVYPPCDCSSLIQFSIEQRENIILSVGQYRPEKAHGLQLIAFKKLLDNHPEYLDNRIRLIFIGGVRNEGDRLRVNELRIQASNLGIEDYCEFLVNADYAVLLHYFSRASIGLHSMWNEHFGISVVEYMAAGVIPIAHNSGGPKSDIVTTEGPSRNGYLASSEDEFASAMTNALSLSGSEKAKLRHSARESVRDRFSETNFKQAFLRSLKPLFV
ncbi:hypothetical protein BJ742DRAFT_549976 [Cladochytrium replicatum]|nr:hypothetical protein BJ742DRAFT_549976 [Cladochytrium replicatum]